jgi:hypothetical protein
MYSRPNLKPNKVPIRTYNNSNQLRILGEFQDKITNHHSSTEVTLTVVAGSGGCLLGYETAAKLNVVKVNCRSHDVDHTKKKYARAYREVFCGQIGKIRNFHLSLQIDKTVRPVCQPHRRIPFDLRVTSSREIAELSPKSGLN